MNLKYDCWLHWNITLRCNLNCIYCFPNENKKKSQINKIKISSLIKTLDKIKKTCLISFTGGEPFLIQNIVDACKEITKKHYISFNTNLTSNKIKEFSEIIDPKKVDIIIASLHIKELERTNLLKKYIDNFHLLKRKGFNIVAKEVAYPPLLKEITKYKKFFKKQGITLEFQPFIGEYKGKKYPDAYTKKEIAAFNFDLSTKEYHQKGKKCNAGYNVGMINEKGDVTPCFSLYNKIGNIYERIYFNKKMIRCPFESCGCPLKIFNRLLFEKAIRETNRKRILSLIDFFYIRIRRILRFMNIPKIRSIENLKLIIRQFTSYI
ncbi:MAG: radical SAM protein [Candidatus Pacearchaeota archaeon]